MLDKCQLAAPFVTGGGHKISHSRVLVGEPLGSGALCGVGGTDESVLRSPEAKEGESRHSCRCQENFTPTVDQRQASERRGLGRHL